jgi:PAS domain S-box-containing protein
MGISLKPFERLAPGRALLVPEPVPKACDNSTKAFVDTDRGVRLGEGKFSGLIDLIPQMVWIVTSQGYGEHFNRYWETYTGIPQAQSSGFGWTYPFHPEDLDRFMRRLHNTTGTGWEIEVRVRRASDGAYRRQLAHRSVIEEADDLRRFVVSCTDVEEWRQAEAAASEQGGLLGLSVRSHDKEKRKVAHGLHDSAGQYLVALQMKLDSLQRCSIGKTGRENPVVDECRDLVNRCSKEIRAVSHLLYPPLLDDLGLESAVRFHVDGVMERIKLKVEMEIEPNLGRLDRDLEVALFRVIQEALTNVHRHSISQTARIKIGANTTSVFVEIAASGGGVELLPVKSLLSPYASSGAGIAIVGQQIREVGGVFELITQPGGSVVRAAVPRKALVAQACD